MVNSTVVIIKKDIVFNREKDQILVKQQSKQAKAEEAVKKAQQVLENLNNQTAAMIMPENEIAGDEDNLS